MQLLKGRHVALSGLTVGLIVPVVAVLLAIGFATKTISIGGDDKGDPPEVVQTMEPERARELAARFAPVLRQHSKERFLPIDRGGYLSAAVLEFVVKGRPARLFKRFLGVSDLPESLTTCPVPGCRFVLDIPNAVEGKAGPYVAVQERILRRRRPTVYWNVTEYPDGAISVQYWFLYVFNDFLNQHESDWEQITLRLDADERPLGAFYSSHEGGEPRPWPLVRKIGEHPIVYPARGSHANYFVNGRYPVPVMKCGRIGVETCLRVEPGRDSADGCGRVLAPADVGESGMTLMVEERCRTSGETVRYRTTKLGPPVFVGSYGPSNRAARGFIVLGEGTFTDPQTRVEWRNPLSLVPGF